VNLRNEPHILIRSYQGGIFRLQNIKWKELVGELTKQWKMLWRCRIDDKIRAEGIADRDYPLLFVEQGTVIIASRNYKPLNFTEILQRHNPSNGIIPPNPAIGGWGKFVRNMLRKKKSCYKNNKSTNRKLKHPKNLQRKKGGRGWLHT
jgi:hypothetical protein